MDFKVHVGDSIQQAIDSAYENGGGRVVVEPGTHACSSIALKSFVELHLTAGAKIQGSIRPDDYEDFDHPKLGGHAPEKSRKCLIRAANAENIAITGTGEINGAGPAFYDTDVPSDKAYAKPPHPRPRMVQFVDCRNVRLEDASFVDSPGWTIWLVECEDVFVRGIRIKGDQQMINNDGIDIDGCRRVMVSDCSITTGDDCIVVRAIRKSADHKIVCEGVTVTNCVLDSWCQGIRIGCPCDDTVRNCSFTNLIIQGPCNGIICDNPKRYLRSDCSGFLDVQNMLFDNIVIDVKRIPIWLHVEEGIRLRRLEGFTFSNMRIASDHNCVIKGSAETQIKDIRFLEVRHGLAFEVHNACDITRDQVQVTPD